MTIQEIIEKVKNDIDKERDDFYTFYHDDPDVRELVLDELITSGYDARCLQHAQIVVVKK